MKIERGCEISPATPVGTLELYAVGVVGAIAVVEVVAAAETESDLVDRDVSRAPALPASLHLYRLVPRHRSSAVTACPVGLRAEDSWIGLVPLLTDVFPLRLVVYAMMTLTAGTLLACKITMLHSNPPFWPPIFLDADYYNI